MSPDGYSISLMYIFPCRCSITTCQVSPPSFDLDIRLISGLNPPSLCENAKISFSFRAVAPIKPVPLPTTSKVCPPSNVLKREPCAKKPTFSLANDIAKPFTRLASPMWICNHVRPPSMDFMKFSLSSIA